MAGIYKKGSESSPRIFEYDFEHNEQGFRITSHKKTDFKKKVVLLGDSFTYGFGVDTESTFAFRLQDSLSQFEVEVLNAGHGGRGTDHALKWLQLYGENPEIQEVIYMVYYNDFSDNYRQEFYELKGEALVAKKLSPQENAFFRTEFYSWLRENSHIYSIFRKVIFKLNPRKYNGSNSFEATPERDFAYELTARYLDAIRNFCIEKDKFFTIYYIPSVAEFEYQEKKLHSSPFLDFFSEYAAENEIQFYDFFSDLENGYARYYLKEGHWNAEGHALAAKQLFADFKKRQKK